MKVVITGTSRGIGLELTRQALEAGHQVLAVARDPQNATELQKLAPKFPDALKILAADVNDPAGRARIVDTAGSWGAVDTLINNAGVYKKGVTETDFTESFRTNTISPYLLTLELLPLLKKGQSPKVISVSSLMGSVGNNSSGGSAAYRASKAALNAIHKSLSIDEPWLTSFVMHPGWVQTDMGGTGATLSIPDSASGIWKVIHNAKPATSGHFLNYTGEELTW